MPQTRRLLEDQALPSVLVTRGLTPVFCTPVRSWVSLQVVNICPSPRAGQLLRLQLTGQGARMRRLGRGETENLQAWRARMEGGLGEGSERQSRYRPLGAPQANMFSSAAVIRNSQPEWHRPPPRLSPVWPLQSGKPWFSTGDFAHTPPSSREHLIILETFLVVTSWEARWEYYWYLSGTGQRCC